jgi:hypothetical protein
MGRCFWKNRMTLEPAEMSSVEMHVQKDVIKGFLNDDRDA